MLNNYVAENRSKPTGNLWLRDYVQAKNSQVVTRDVPTLKCRKCSGAHYLDRCPEMREMTVENRLEYVNKERLCRNCLRFGHFANQCQKPQLCRVQNCKIIHNYLLHKAEEREMNEKKEEKSNSYVSSQREDEAKQQSNQWISLRTVPVILRTQDRTIRVNALLDDGSTTSYINQEVADFLQLKGDKKSLVVKVIGGVQQQIQSELVKLDLINVGGEVVTKFAALTMKSVVGNLKVINWAQEKMRWAHLNDVVFPSIGKKDVVDV